MTNHEHDGTTDLHEIVSVEATRSHWLILAGWVGAYLSQEAVSMESVLAFHSSMIEAATHGKGVSMDEWTTKHESGTLGMSETDIAELRRKGQEFIRRFREGL